MKSLRFSLLLILCVNRGLVKLTRYPPAFERESQPYRTEFLLSSPLRFLPIQIRSILCVFSTGEPCKDRLILTAIPSKFGAHDLRFFCFCSTVQTFSKIFKSGQKKSPVCVCICICICICIIHKTRSICFSNITKKTKENDEKCLGSQIKKIEICIGDWLD